MLVPMFQRVLFVLNIYIIYRNVQLLIKTFRELFVYHIYQNDISGINKIVKSRYA